MKKKILTCGLLLLATMPALFGQSKRHVLWYDSPAPNGGSVHVIQHRGFPFDSDWEKYSLPLGNGYMGVNLFGRTDTERIQLTEKTLGVKGPYGNGGITNFLELYLDIQHEEPEAYRRELSLDEGVARVSYRYHGVKYSREYFANYPSRVVVVTLKADQPGKISFLLRPVLPYLHPYNEELTGRKGTVFAENDLITLSGEMQFFKQPYEAQIKVIPHGGSLQAFNDIHGDHGMIRVNEADSVSLIITAQTNYQLNESLFVLPPEQKVAGYAHPHEAVCQTIAHAVSQGVEALRKEHEADYCGLYGRVELSLTDSVPDQPTDRLVEAYQKGKQIPYLEELLFQYGRYLLIASSRRGAPPAHLQGAWNAFDYALWSGGYWHNINVQMNYWPAFSANLTETFEAYADFNKAFRKKANALATDYIKQNNPSALASNPEENGWTIGTGANAFSITAPGGHSGPGTGGFTTKLFWDYYDFTRDKEILRHHVYPALRGMAKFLSKTLKPDAEGHLLATPSSSPEQYHQGKYYQTVGCTFDQSMIQENFMDLLKAADILKIKDAFLDTIKAQLPKLDAIHIGTSGQIKEYREEQAYGDIGDPRHRHISHLCALYPGTLISSHTPEWLKAATVTLERRGDLSTGWAMVHRQCLWARVKQGERAYREYNLLLKNRMCKNLWLVHPPFQVDANLGAVAGVVEMLLQSHEGYISILPALPSQWTDGAFSGLLARGNFEVSAQWKQSALQQVEILSNLGEPCICQYPGISKAQVVDEKGKRIKVKCEGTDRIRFATKPHSRYTITF